MWGVMTLVHKILIVLASAIAMEFVAWFAHRYIMHGFGWGWHRDHHRKHDGFFEKNDLYALFGAALSLGLFIIGDRAMAGPFYWEPGTYMGLGVMLYGIVYTLIHDGLVHQRWFRYVPRRGYMKRLVQAHHLHHVTHSKEGGVSFGFVFARDPNRLKQDLMRQRRDSEVKLRRAQLAQSGTESGAFVVSQPPRERRSGSRRRRSAR